MPAGIDAWVSSRSSAEAQEPEDIPSDLRGVARSIRAHAVASVRAPARKPKGSHRLPTREEEEVADDAWDEMCAPPPKCDDVVRPAVRTAVMDVDPECNENNAGNATRKRPASSWPHCTATTVCAILGTLMAVVCLVELDFIFFDEAQWKTDAIAPSALLSNVQSPSQPRQPLSPRMPPPLPTMPPPSALPLPPPPCPQQPPSVPPSTPPPAHMPSKPPSPPQFLDAAQCEAFLSNPHHRFHQLWSPGGWTVRKAGGDACWWGDGLQFFDDAWWGVTCEGRNWYTGNDGLLGAFSGGGPTNTSGDPHFTAPTWALLGFDESIEEFCTDRGGWGRHSQMCVRANLNILSLYGDAIPYNTCRNLEWQVCAAKGTLPGQFGNPITFAFAPGSLEAYTGPHPIGSCTGYHPGGCFNRGYASSDIFYLEVCIYSLMCSNRDELFSLKVGDAFHCKMDWEGWQKLRDWVLAGPAI